MRTTHAARRSTAETAAIPTLETRLLRGRSRRTAARSLGIHHSHLSRILTGERSVSVELLLKLAEATGLSASELLSEIPGTKKARPKSRK